MIVNWKGNRGIGWWKGEDLNTHLGCVPMKTGIRRENKMKVWCVTEEEEEKWTTVSRAILSSVNYSIS